MQQIQAARHIPADHEAEQRLLACVVANPSVALTRLRGISTTDFDEPRNRTLWVAALTAHAINDKRCDALLFLDFIKANGLVEQIGGVSRLQELGGAGANPTMADVYAKKIADAAEKRAYYYAAEGIIEKAVNGCPAEALKSEWRKIGDVLDGDFQREDGWTEFDGDDLVSTPETALLEYWPGLVVAEHVLLLAGTAKTGKSWLLYAFLGAMSRGESWLGNPAPAKPIRAYIVSEEPRSRVRSKLHRFGVLGAKGLARGDIRPEATWSETVDRAARGAEKHGCGIILFDTLGGLAQIEKENDNSEANRALHPVLQAAGRTKTAVIVSHHAPNALRRGQGPKRVLRAVDFVRGAGALAANPDALAGLDNDENPDGPRRLLVAEGRFDRPPLRVLITYRAPSEGIPGGYDLVGRPGEVTENDAAAREVSKSNLMDARIVAVLEKDPTKGFTRTRIRQRLGAGSYVDYRLNALVELGRIRRDEGKRANDADLYFISQPGGQK
jgi:hypothetical protein